MPAQGQKRKPEPAVVPKVLVDVSASVGVKITLRINGQIVVSGVE